MKELKIAPWSLRVQEGGCDVRAPLAQWLRSAVRAGALWMFVLPPITLPLQAAAPSLRYHHDYLAGEEHLSKSRESMVKT